MNLAMLRRWAPVAVVVLLMLALAAVTVGPANDGLALDPASTAPDGTAAVVAVARELGTEVVVAEAPGDLGPEGVILVLRDPRDEAWNAALEQALEGGATVVVTDPDAALAPDPGDGFFAPSTAPECPLAPLRDVQAITGTGFVALKVPAEGVGCFPADDGLAWLVATPHPAGTVVVTGGAAFLTNGAIDSADNAVLALSLLAPEGARRLVVVGPGIALTAGGGASLTELIPAQVKAALWQLLIGGVVVVAWRWRRLGAPVAEPLPVVLPGSDLVVARGALLQQARAHGHAARLLSEALRRDLAARFGLDPGASPGRVARAAAGTVGMAVEDLEALLRGPARRAAQPDDAGPSPGGGPGASELVAHARRVAEVRAAAGIGVPDPGTTPPGTTPPEATTRIETVAAHRRFA